MGDVSGVVVLYFFFGAVARLVVLHLPIHLEASNTASGDPTHTETSTGNEITRDHRNRHL